MKSVYSRKSNIDAKSKVTSASRNDAKLKSQTAANSLTTRSSVFQEPTFLERRAVAHQNNMKNYQRNPLGSPRHINNKEIYDQRI